MSRTGHTRECMLARKVGRADSCTDRCPFWEEGGAVVASGCGLERILPAEDWSPELAEGWLHVRATAGSAENWQPTSFLSTLLG